MLENKIYGTTLKSWGAFIEYVLLITTDKQTIFLSL